MPANLIPSGEREVDRVATRGVRSDQCRAKQGDPSSASWAYTGAEADLIDAQGKAVGRHAFPPSVWELSDGSKIAGGQVKARVDAPVPNADPWILVSTRSAGGDGRLSKVTSLQRINTVGGVAPSMKCDTGSVGSSSACLSRRVSCSLRSNTSDGCRPGAAPSAWSPESPGTGHNTPSERNSGRIVGIETTDKMTDRQIAAKVRQYFRDRPASTTIGMNPLPSAFWCISATEMLQQLGTTKEGLSGRGSYGAARPLRLQPSEAAKAIECAHAPSGPIQESDHPPSFVCYGVVVLPP